MSNQTPVPASLANMRKFYRPGVFAWSPITGDECSADPRDYFMLSDDAILRDDDGHEMYMAYRVEEISLVDHKEWN